MIVKNEEDVLARCLGSAKPAFDEIVIVDTGSTDNTKRIAAEYTDKIYDFKWIDDFSAARNFCFSKASMEYIMWLDADDIIPEDDLNEILELKKNLPVGTDMVTMQYVLSVNENGDPIFTSTRERIFRREKNFLWEGPVHECIPISGRVFNTEIKIRHMKPAGRSDPLRNLKIYENLEKNSELTPRQLYYYARELMDNGRFEKAVSYFGTFLATDLGWVEDNIASCYSMARCQRQLGDEDSAFRSLIKSFEYAPPRAEICSELGYYYMRRNQYKEAAVWFHIAANLGEPSNLGFILRDYWDYIPNIELCVCYYNLGDHERAKYHNELALAAKPGDRAALSNQTLFTR